MKGEAVGAAKAQPLTLGMLERLEGIVKVKDQQKFNVRSGREYLIAGVFILLFFSFAQYALLHPTATVHCCTVSLACCSSHREKCLRSLADGHGSLLRF